MKSNLCGFLRLHFDAAKQQGTKIAWSFSQMHVYVISWLPLRCSLFRVYPKLTQQHLTILRQNRVGFLLYRQYLQMVYDPNLTSFPMNKKNLLQINESVRWIGVLDHNLVTFDIVMETKNGTTYNSFFIDAEKTEALFNLLDSKHIGTAQPNVQPNPCEEVPAPSEETSYGFGQCDPSVKEC